MPEKQSHLAGNQVAAGLSTNGSSAQAQHTTKTLAEIQAENEALARDSKVEPADVLSAKKVAAVLPTVASYQGIALQAALDALRALIGYLPADEREALYPSFIEHKFFAKHDDWEKFLATCPAPPGSPIFKPLTLAEVIALPPKVWIIDQVLGAGDLGTIYGPPGCGKTFVIIDLAYCAALRLQWARRFDVLKPLEVAYCAGEGVSGLSSRFAAAAEHYGVDNLPNLTIYNSAPQLFNVNTSETIARFVRERLELQAQGAAKPLDLLIIDTMHSAIVGADENSSQDMGQVLDASRAAIRALGCAVLLVHHTNKAGTGERGSSSIRGAMDTMIEIKPVASKFSLNCEKVKDGKAWKPQTFDLTAIGDSVRVWWDEVTETESKGGKQDQDVSALVTMLKSSAGRKYTANTLAEAIGIGGSKQVFKLLPKAMQKDPAIKCGLRYPGKDSSSQNPMVYWYEIPSESPTQS